MEGLGLALLIGIVAGLRAAMPLAALRLANHDWTSVLFALLALGELVGDKLPFTPARTMPGALGARALVGAYAGWVLAGAHGALAPAGAVLGAGGAMAAAYAGLNYRRRAARLLHWPDLPLALIEDAAGISLAAFCVNA